jgi:predicted anti-sigma-YlaC factor YlaD
MTDCSNIDIREQLPDYVSGMLSRVDVERVEHHLSSCTDCSEELAILREVFALRPAAIAVDVNAIVAALPRPRKARRNSWQQWRIAAALATVAIGGLSWQVARSGVAGIDEGQVPDSITIALNDTGKSGDNALLGGEVAVSFGDLGNYSDAEVEQILDRLEKWDGATSPEPVSSLPLLPSTEGNSR